jgi:hypothetical protein
MGDRGVPFGAIWIIGLSDDAEERVSAAASAALALPLPRPVVEIGPYFSTYALAARCRRIWPPRVVLRRGDAVRARVHELFRGLESHELLVALGGARTEVGVRITVRDDAPAGWAASVDPQSGDPEVVAVGVPPGAAWLLDRKTMRLVRRGDSEIPVETVGRAADLADRAQLALGRPIELTFGQLRGQLVVHGVRPLELSPCFTDTPFRRVALLSADEGPVAPLAIDALDKALRSKEGARDDRPAVVRFYARAYRRTGLRASGRSQGPGVPLLRATARAAQVATDLARPLAAARAFGERFRIRIAELDRQDLAGSDPSVLLTSSRERMNVVVEALSLLESARVATRAAISALEATCGPLPRECVAALAAIRKTRTRRRAEERLWRLARQFVDQLGEIPELHRIPSAMRKRWDEVRTELRELRPLGVDVRPVPYGSSDRELHAALVAMVGATPDAEEIARREAVRRLLATARVRPLGRAREMLARSIAIGLSQLAEVKGQLGEALALAMLRLRSAACAVGRQLVERGILEDPEDALYLDLAELEEAISGEPGAYAARVRLRREADLRWRNYDPPWRLAARPR